MIAESYIASDAIDDLTHSLSEKRYKHSVRVCETAFRIADAWSVAIDRTALAWAGLFHDCAKEFSAKKRDSFIRTQGPLPCGEELLEVGPLAHGPVGALVLQAQFGLYDEAVHRAVAYHSVGHLEFDAMGWAVSLADFLEPGRKWLDAREEVLQRACEDPVEGIRAVMDLRVEVQEGKGKTIHPAVYAVRDAVMQSTFSLE